MTENTTTPEQSLSLLNNSLYAGYLLKTNYHQQYDVDSKVEGFDITKYLKQYEEDINKWYGPVAKFIFDNYERHLYFHFIQPKSDAMSYSHPLGNLTHVIEKHLFALEDVIQRIEERNNLEVRREIAEKEYGSDTLYKITFSWHTRELLRANMTNSVKHLGTK